MVARRAVFFVLLLCSGVRGATVVNSWTYGAASGGGVVTPAIDTTGCTGFVVMITGVDTGSPFTLTDNKGNAYSVAVSRGVAAGSVRTQCVYCASALAGTGHTFSVSGTRMAVVVYGCRGLASAPLDVTSSFQGGGGGISPAGITPSQNGDLVFSAVGLGSGTSGVASVSNAGDFIGVVGVGVAANNVGLSASVAVQNVANGIAPVWSWAGSGTAAGVHASFKTQSGVGGGASGQGDPKAANCYWLIGHCGAAFGDTAHQAPVTIQLQWASGLTETVGCGDYLPVGCNLINFNAIAPVGKNFSFQLDPPSCGAGGPFPLIGWTATSAGGAVTGALADTHGVSARPTCSGACGTCNTNPNGGNGNPAGDDDGDGVPNGCDPDATGCLDANGNGCCDACENSPGGCHPTGCDKEPGTIVYHTPGSTPDKCSDCDPTQVDCPDLNHDGCCDTCTAEMCKATPHCLPSDPGYPGCCESDPENPSYPNCSACLPSDPSYPNCCQSDPGNPDYPACLPDPNCTSTAGNWPNCCLENPEDPRYPNCCPQPTPECEGDGACDCNSPDYPACCLSNPENPNYPECAPCSGSCQDCNPCERLDTIISLLKGEGEQAPSTPSGTDPRITPSPEPAVVAPSIGMANIPSSPDGYFESYGWDFSVPIPGQTPLSFHFGTLPSEWQIGGSSLFGTAGVSFMESAVEGLRVVLRSLLAFGILWMFAGRVIALLFKV